MLNFSLFIAKRLYKDPGSKKPVSQLATNIAIYGIAIGLAVMIISLCVVLGFKKEISSRIIDYGSDIQVLNMRSTTSTESYPINCSPDILEAFQNTEGIKIVQRTSNVFGIVKTNTDYKGVFFKGISPEYDSTFLEKCLIEGSIPRYSHHTGTNDILISQLTANGLNLKLHDKIYAYFFDNTIKVRRFVVAGIFDTNIQQFDDNIIYTNIYTVNQINKWDDNQCSTLEIKKKKKKTSDEVLYNILETIRGIKDVDVSDYVVYTIQQLYSQIFDWLKLLDLDTIVILVLMIILACLTMTSGLLILILEKTATIGILKSTGATNRSIRKVFIYYATFIIGRGIFWGYFGGLGLSFIQYNWHIISMDASKYYVSYVPILFNWPIIIAIGLSTFAICIIALLGPSYIITQISPSKTVKFR